MNSLYIGIGVAIIMALVTALVGPYFVDWSHYRSAFESEGQRIFGENVTVLGAAEVRLLPMPSIVLNDVVIGPVDHPDLKVDRLDIKIEIAPLLKGAVRISELRLERPVMRIGIDSDGKPVLPGMYNIFTINRVGPDVSGVGLDLAEIVDGRVSLFDERNASEVTLEGLNGTASAETLSGPIRLDGGARLSDHPFSFHFATGKRGDHGQWPLRLTVNPTEGPFQLNAEALLEPGDAAALKGSISLQRLALSEGKSDKFEADTAPWQIDTQFSADVGQMSLDQIQMSVGSVEAAYAMTGNGRFVFGRVPSFDVTLAARQFDLDRLIAQKIDEPVDPVTALGRLGALMQQLPKTSLDGRLAVAIGGIVIGGGAVQDLDLDLHTRADGWRIDRFAARLPGRSTLSLSGRMASDAVKDMPRFVGDIALNSDQPQALLQWWRREPSPFIEPFALKGHVVRSSDALRVEDMTLGLGPAKARGGFAFQAGTSLRGPQFSARVSADTLNLDQARVVARLVASGLGAGTPSASVASGLSPDLSLDLDAGTVVVGDQPLKGVVARVAYDGVALKIDQLTVKDAAGAAIDVKGRIDKLTTTPDGAIEGSITADRPDGLVRLLQTWLPGQAWVNRLAAAAPALQHFKATGRLTGDAGLDASNVHLTLDGTAATSRLALEARFGGRLDRLRDGQLDASVSIEGPDGGLVLRQVGIPALSDGASAGKLLLSVKGVPATGLALAANADLAGLKLAMSGTASVDADGVTVYAGEAQVKANDLRQPATMIGQALPSTALSVPLEARARVTGRGAHVAIEQMTGRLADAGFNGDAKIDLAQWPVRIDGSLQSTEGDLDTLLELGLGPDALVMPQSKGAVWPTEVLSGPLVSTVNATIDLKSDRLSIDQTRGVDQFAATLRLRPGQVLFDDVHGRLAGGQLTGALQLSRPGGAAMVLAGNLALKDAHLGDLIWRRDDRAVAEGAFDLAATFETSGRSVAALAAALSGNGAFTARDGLLRYVDPGAFSAIIAAADGGLEIKDDKIRAIFVSKLDAGVLPFSRIESTFGLNAGVLRTSDIAVTSPLARTTGSVAIDLGRWTMSGDWTLKVDPGRKGVVGAEPQVGIVFNGPLDAPKRTIDVAPLSAFLTLRAFEREVERVEDLQADIVERQRFQRELKRLNDQRRDAEAAQKAAEATAKQKAAEDARKAIEAKQAEDARKIEAARKAEEARQLEAQRTADAARKAASEATKPPAPAPPDTPVSPAGPTTVRPADGSQAVPPATPIAPTAPGETQAPIPPPLQDKPATLPAAADTLPKAESSPMPAKPSEKPAAPIPVPTDRPNVEVPGTTQSVRMRPSGSDQPRALLPELPPVIFIGPRPPVMPAPVPAVPTAP